MSLYDVIAAGHRGQCFALMARRFMISEPQAALAVRHLLPVLLPSFEAWISAPGGLASFLEAMERSGYEKALVSPAVLSNHFERDRGLHLLEQFRSVREFDGAAFGQAVAGSGLSYRVLVQMLPYVALFFMGALRTGCEAPLRDVLARRMGSTVKAAANPFAELSQMIAWETKGERHGLLANVLGGLLGNISAARDNRQTVAATSPI